MCDGVFRGIIQAKEVVREEYGLMMIGADG